MELLVVIGVIAILLALVVPATAGARRQATRVAASSDLRQLTLVYLQYAELHRGTLLPGYLPSNPPAVYSKPNDATITGTPARRWPYRMATVSPEVWKLIRPARQTTELLQAGAEGASLYPVYGLNTVYLGGHARGSASTPDFFAGFTADGRPNVGRHVAFKLTDVRRHARQLVFGEVQIRNGAQVVRADEGVLGFHYINPPRANGAYWNVIGGRVRVVADPSRAIGVPYSRASIDGGGPIPVSFLDGHVESLEPADLLDMRLWANAADGPGWDFVP